MRIKNTSTSEPAKGYTLWLSARDTYDWTHKPGACWPCSTLSDKCIVVCVDSNGLCDLTVNGRSDSGNIDADELRAIVADHLPAGYRHLWPVWK